jgi:hypothetical protein
MDLGNPLAGEWNVDGRSGIVWKFTTHRKVVYSSGAKQYEGLWLERRNGHTIRKTCYRYDQFDRLLVLEHTALDADRFVVPAEIEVYRIDSLAGSAPPDRWIRCHPV